MTERPIAQADTAGTSHGSLALWSDQQADIITITDQAETVVDELKVAAVEDPPGPRVLAQTRWSGYPGSEWAETTDGRWSRHVFLLRSWRDGGA